MSYYEEKKEFYKELDKIVKEEQFIDDIVHKLKRKFGFSEKVIKKELFDFEQKGFIRIEGNKIIPTV